MCAGHGIAGDKAAQYAGKSILRTLSNCALLRGAKRTSASNYNAEIENAVRTAFMKGHSSGLDLYTSPPESVVYTVDKGWVCRLS